MKKLLIFKQMVLCFIISCVVGLSVSFLDGSAGLVGWDCH
jgi:hypothetical protein